MTRLIIRRQRLFVAGLALTIVGVALAGATRGARDLWAFLPFLLLAVADAILLALAMVARESVVRGLMMVVGGFAVLLIAGSDLIHADWISTGPLVAGITILTLAAFPTGRALGVVKERKKTLKASGTNIAGEVGDGLDHYLGA